MVYDWARHAGLQAEDAGDVVQEVFRNLVKALSQFQPDLHNATFRGWLRTITRHKVVDALRYQADRPQATGGSDAHERLLLVPEAASDVSSMHGRNSPNAQFAHALESVRSEFEERTWQAFWSVVVEGVHSTDAAANLGISANAVYIARSRVMRRLREYFSDEA
jgi:RNA polymerase sigma-70 factor (ECF subfamily)